MATTIETTPQRVDYVLTKGDTWNPGTITVNFGGTVTNGVVSGGINPDLTGYSAQMQIRSTLSNSVVKTLSSPSSGITLSSSGVITISMSKTETAALAIGEYLYDLQITSPEDEETTYICGYIGVSFDKSSTVSPSDTVLVLNTASPISLVFSAGIQGETGIQGDQGDPGQGVPTGGTAGQLLAKIDSSDYNTEWIDPSTGSIGTGESGVSVVGESILLGNEIGGTSAELSRDTEIPLNGHKIAFTGTGQVLIGGSAADPFSGTASSIPFAITRGDTALPYNTPIISISDVFGGTHSSAITEQVYVQTPGDEFPAYSNLMIYYNNVGGGGYNNFIQSEGFNVGTAGRIDTSMPAQRKNRECKYEISAHGFCQEVWESTTAISGKEVRWLYYIANRDTLSNSSLFLTANQFEIRNSDTETTTLALGKNGSLSLYGTVQSLFSFETPAAGNAFLRHRNAANTAYLDILTAHSDGITFGKPGYDFFCESDMNFLSGKAISFKSSTTDPDRMTLSGNFATGEYRMFAGAGGYFLTFYESNAELMRMTGGSVMVGTTTYNASAALNVSSTSKGFLPPRMTTTQRNAISSPAEGLVIYNTTTHKLNVYTTAWEQVTSA